MPSAPLFYQPLVQARVLATDRGIACATVDYDALRGLDDPSHRLF